MELYVSYELLKLKGKDYFKDLSYDDFKGYAIWGKNVKTEDDMYLSRDDMDNLYLSLNQGEESFTNVEDL